VPHLPIRTRSLSALAQSIVALAGIAVPVRAQQSEVQPGARVRIEAPGIVAGRYVGTVLTRSADTLELGTPKSAPIKVPVARITSLELSRGSSRSLGAVRGLVWGTPIGLVLGVLAAAGTSGDPYCYDNCGTSGGYKAGLILGGTVSGALWGAGIGALVGREHWERFDVTPRTSFDAPQRRTTFGLAMTF